MTGRVNTVEADLSTVLVSDDDAAIRRLLVRRLEQEGYAVEQRGGGEALVDLVHELQPTLILRHADDQTADDLERLRRDDWVPLILIADADGPGAPADLLDLGADDVVVKPFSPREVVARVRATLRRATRSPDAIVRSYPGLRVDLKARTVVANGEPVDLARREYDLLAFLSRHPTQVFTRGQLLAHVWSSDEGWLGPATVTEHVRRVRLRLGAGPDGHDWIETVRGVGYRFRV